MKDPFFLRKVGFYLLKYYGLYKSNHIEAFLSANKENRKIIMR